LRSLEFIFEVSMYYRHGAGTNEGFHALPH
jgi:hypothetical protein